jgi:hypothetical protein
MITSRSALHDLSAALESQRRSSEPDLVSGTWRWKVRQHLAGIRDLLVNESSWHQDSWLAARGGAVLRERNALLARVSVLGPQVLQSTEVAGLRRDLQRLVADVAHHLQRVHDLAYDEVEYELGGSE